MMLRKVLYCSVAASLVGCGGNKPQTPAQQPANRNEISKAQSKLDQAVEDTKNGVKNAANKVDQEANKAADQAKAKADELGDKAKHEADKLGAQANDAGNKAASEVDKAAKKVDQEANKIGNQAVEDAEEAKKSLSEKTQELKEKAGAALKGAGQATVGAIAGAMGKVASSVPKAEMTPPVTPVVPQTVAAAKVPETPISDLYDRYLASKTDAERTQLSDDLVDLVFQKNDEIGGRTYVIRFLNAEHQQKLRGASDPDFESKKSELVDKLERRARHADQMNAVVKHSKEAGFILLGTVLAGYGVNPVTDTVNGIAYLGGKGAGAVVAGVDGAKGVYNFGAKKVSQTTALVSRTVAGAVEKTEGVQTFFSTKGVKNRSLFTELVKTGLEDQPSFVLANRAAIIEKKEFDKILESRRPIFSESQAIGVVRVLDGADNGIPQYSLLFSHAEKKTMFRKPNITYYKIDKLNKAESELAESVIMNGPAAKTLEPVLSDVVLVTDGDGAVSRTELPRPRFEAFEKQAAEDEALMAGEVPTPHVATEAPSADLPQINSPYMLGDAPPREIRETVKGAVDGAADGIKGAVDVVADASLAAKETVADAADTVVDAAATATNKAADLGRAGLQKSKDFAVRQKANVDQLARRAVTDFRHPLRAASTALAMTGAVAFADWTTPSSVSNTVDYELLRPVTAEVTRASQGK